MIRNQTVAGQRHKASPQSSNHDSIPFCNSWHCLKHTPNGLYHMFRVTCKSGPKWKHSRNSDKLPLEDLGKQMLRSKSFSRAWLISIVLLLVLHVPGLIITNCPASGSQGTRIFNKQKQSECLRVQCILSLQGFRNWSHTSL